uniref:Ig-like domain-containing protein n=1 Tax=Canis lupus dingo TaxID=286419 RepID=A0A8C0KL70_CANLU
RGGQSPTLTSKDVRWQLLILRASVSLLTFQNSPTTAQVTVESVPIDAAEGKDVLLRVHNLPGNLLGYDWKHTSDYPGACTWGRETAYPNRSLLFQNITLNDMGYYTLQIIKKKFQIEQVLGQLRVFRISSLMSAGHKHLPPDQPQITVESVPPNAAEGKDVLLRVHNLPGDTASLAWFRGETVAPVHQIVLYVVDTRVITPGPAYSGREIIYPSGSLLFQNITLNDTGSYILQIINRKFETALVRGQLRGPRVTDSVNADSVVLMCEAQTQSTSCLWSVNSKSLPDSPRLELSLDNRTLTVHGVTRNDTGPYECETRNPVSADHSDPFTLNVLC